MNSPTQALADRQLPVEDAVARIEKINEGLRAFWSSSHGWAPAAAADLMSKSRLDWQVSLSRSLRHWVIYPPDIVSDGDLILGWANLGSLIEGTIKLLLAVYYDDYKRDLDTLKHTQAWHNKKKVPLDPDNLRFETLIDYIKRAQLFDADEIKLFELVQGRRNAIHAFRDRCIGTGSELHAAIKNYLGTLRSVALRLPYPEDRAFSWMLL
jgi:hypothetical protein